eukprot:3702046-Alexandrium_andersonii.AAC.1
MLAPLAAAVLDVPDLLRGPPLYLEELWLALVLRSRLALCLALALALRCTLVRARLGRPTRPARSSRLLVRGRRQLSQARDLPSDVVVSPVGADLSR